MLTSRGPQRQYRRSFVQIVRRASSLGELDTTGASQRIFAKQVMVERLSEADEEGRLAKWS
jgi:hypothetical protein